MIESVTSKSVEMSEPPKLEENTVNSAVDAASTSSVLTPLTKLFQVEASVQLASMRCRATVPAQHPLFGNDNLAEITLAPTGTWPAALPQILSKLMRA